MNKLSAVIITYNEEKNIQRCLESVKEIADEIVVVDSFSTDKTEEISNQYNAKFIKNNFDGYIEQKNFAKNQAEFDYVLSLDADEALSDKLIIRIKSLKQEGFKYDGYYFNRLTNYCGKWIKHSGWYPDTKLRLWNRHKGEWQGMNPHDEYKLAPGAKAQHIKLDILHYSYHSLDQHLRQMVSFSAIGALSKYNKGKKISVPLLMIRPYFTFIKKYILKGGFLDGYYGYVIAMLSAFGTFQKDVLLREHCKEE